MNRLGVFALMLALTAGCKDKQEDSPAQEKIYFTGITHMDTNGGASGPGDETDWRMDDVWKTQEKDLFTLNNLPLCSATSDSLGISAFPNPCEDRIFLGTQTPSGTNWHFRFVDENFTLIKSFDFDDVPPNYNTLNVNVTDFPKDTVRVYYQIEKGGCAWRGHGDILVK